MLYLLIKCLHAVALEEIPQRLSNKQQILSQVHCGSYRIIFSKQMKEEWNQTDITLMSDGPLQCEPKCT